MRVRRILGSILAASLLMLQGIPAMAAPPSTIISVADNMDFGAPAGGTGTPADPYIYTNIVSKDGISVDAEVTMVSKTSATLDNIDGSDPDPAVDARFNPVITTNPAGNINFRFDFIDHATGTPVYLKDFYVTIIDLDGTSGGQEFAEVSGFASYTVNNPTGLVIGAGTQGRTRFRGLTTTQAGIIFNDASAFIANYTEPVNTLNVLLGNTGALSGRLFSVNFGLPGGVFSSPVDTPNAQTPSLTVQIQDGDGVLTPTDNLQNVTISGTTNAGAGQPVNLEITGSDNNPIYWNSTATASGYTISGDLSALPDGPITVVANTVNAVGNPASATDTTTKDTATRTAVSCAPDPATVGGPVTCTATVVDQRPAAGIHPDGYVQFGDDSSGVFQSSRECTLANGSCQVTYTPGTGSMPSVLISAYYQGTTIRAQSDGSTSLAAHAAPTISSAVVYVKGSTQLTASGGVGSLTYTMQTDNSNGATVNSTGFYKAGLIGGVTDTVQVTDANGGPGTGTVQVNKRPTATKVTCTPAELMVGTTATCNVTVTDTSAEATPVAVTGTVTFHSTGAGSFGSAGVCTLTNATCSVTYTPTGNGPQTISAGYDSSVSHAVSDSTEPGGSNQSLTVDAALTIDPSAAQVPVYGAQPFTATGGVGSRTFSLVEGASVATGSVGASTGNYTGGNQAGTAVTVRVQDSQGNKADGTVTLVRRTTTASVDCAPAATDQAAPVTCTAAIQDTSNGTQQPLGPANVSFTTDASGSFGQRTCTGTTTLMCTLAYTPTGGGSAHTVTVRYAQSAVHEASDGTTAVTVYAPVTLSAPAGAVYVKSAKQFTATGGDGTYTYSVTADQSGGATVDGSGVYTAGLTGGKTDTVKVTDSRGKPATATVTVNKRPTSLAVTCTPATFGIGGTATCTATVTDTSGEAIPVAATGIVAFSSTQSGIFGTAGTCALTNGACSVTYKPGTDGTHTISATYGGSGSHLASDSNGAGGQNQTLTVNKRGTHTEAVCDPNAVTVGLPVTCTVTVTDTDDPAQTPSGTVTWTTNETGSFGAASCTLDPHGQCAVTYTPGGGIGTHTVTAGYAPSAVNAGSSGTAPVTVYAALTLTSPSAAVYVRGTAQLTAAGGDGSYTYTVQTNSSGGAAVNGSGLYTAGLTGGVTDTVKVTDGRGIEATAAVTVNKRPTGTEVTCTPATLVIGASTTCTATVTDTSGDATPVAVQGTVTFSSTQTGTFGPATTCSLTNGACTVIYKPATDGTHMLSAAYGGSVSHLVSDSSEPGGRNQSLTVSKRGISSGVVCDPDPIALGVTATCTVTVTDTTDPTQVPSGSVTWTHSGTGTFGSDSCTLDANGRCTVTYTPTVAGENVHTITATIEGNETRGGATSSDSLVVRAGSLTGTVKTEVQDPVAGITLFLTDGSGQTRATATTSDTGSYSFTELPGGSYTVKVRSESTPLAQATASVPGGSVATLDIVLPSTATLSLTANPPKIVGDGKKISSLTATLTADGAVIGGVDVLFQATAGTLFEIDPKTGSDGSARAKLRAPLIQGVNEVVHEASVKVHDVPRGLFAHAKIGITFAPASVDGVVMDNGDPRMPIAGAKVHIHKTFADGATFAGEAVTDSEGRYSIIVPKGNTTYQVEITAAVTVGGLKKAITTTQTATLGDLSGIGEAIPATRTIGGQLFAPDKQGGISAIDVTLISGQQLAGFLRRTSDGTELPNPVLIAANGAFQVADVPIGSYQVVLQVQAPNGERLAGAVVPVTVANNGELTLGAALVDPFGIVTDVETRQPIRDVRVDLRWADTPLNVGKGRKPDERVALPPLPDFRPNQNRVSQNTTGDGEYAFMVFPDGDYYVVANKAGYERHESPIIHVGEAIVAYNFEMQKRPPEPSAPPDPPAPSTSAVPAAPQAAKVRGTVVDTLLGRPISGARVTIREDFNGDGVLDVDAGVHTAADGSYELVVPQRNRTYTAQVATTLPVQGKPRQFTATQRIFVPANAEMTDTATAQNAIAGQLYFVAPGGGEALALTPPQARALQATVQTMDGSPINKLVSISDAGYYQVDDLALGTYRILFQSKATDGGLVPVAAVTVPINSDGQLSLQATVIDPFGTVRAGDTSAPIPDALVSLFWADTPLNRGSGRTPGTLVNLPAIAPFAADNNANPYLSNSSGRYGWFCPPLPLGDYYLIAKKDGYLPYDSRNDTRVLTLASGSLLQNGILHVATTGCTYDLVLQPMKIEVLDRHTRYVQGYPDGSFRPENAVTRAEVAAIFARLMKVDLSGVKPAVMTDLQETDWASRHIAVVMKAGLFTGYPDGSFGPDKPITRAELAAVIARFKGLAQGKRGVFQDTVGHWAEPYITATFDAGIVLGFTDNTFGPAQTTRRSELVAMVNRMLGRGQLMTGRTQPRWPDVPFSHWAVRHIEEASISHSSRLGEEQTEMLIEEFADTIE